MVWVQECLSLAKEYTKQDIVGYYFEVSLAKEYTKEDILQWFECRNVSLWLKNIPKKMLLATRPSKKFNDQYGGKMCQNLCRGG